MAVTSVELHWSGQTGNFGFDLSKEYTAVWQVKTDSPLDGPGIVVAAVTAEWPLGINYAIGNEYDPHAILRNLVPTRDSKSRTKWMVVGKFDNSHERGGDNGQPPTGTDQNGDPTQNPLEFRDEIESHPATFSGPVAKAKNYFDGLQGRPSGTLGPVVNSANVAFNPPPMRDWSGRIFRIMQNRPTYPSLSWEYELAINSQSFSLKKTYLNFDKQFLPYQIKLAPLQSSSQLQNGISFWKIVWELHYKKDGWRDLILDRGTSVRALPGDPDGRGGTISDNDLQPGEPRVRRLIDKNGNPINEPVLLDGHGHALASGGTPVFLEYGWYSELPFDILPL